MEKLPGDILNDILIRLPAKQLAQARCVSKPWCALLSRPGFIKSHRDHHSLHDDHILLVFNREYDLCTVYESKSSNTKLIDDLIKIPLNFPSMDIVIGSVNGLICFLSYDKHCDHDPIIYIWNPSLSALITLPPDDHVFLMTGFYEFFFRFGYDPKTDDYKVVKLSYDYDIAHDIEVYSMRNKSWKFITERFPVDVKSIYDVNEVCLDGHDGHIHWLCSYVVEDIELLTLVAFDLGMEMFSVIPLPDSVRKERGGRLNRLGCVVGKLCFMSHTRCGEFQVWVMQEYGVVESWVKHSVSSKFSGANMNPIGFTLNNKFVYYNYDYDTKEHYNSITLYDLDTTKTDICNCRHLNLYERVFVVPYVDSLVWVAH